MSPKYLEKFAPLPRVLQEGLKLYGCKEKAGRASNPEILRWADELRQAGIGVEYDADEIPWCGLFAAISCHRAGKDIKPVETPLWARSWVRFGRGLEPAEAASLGDVLVFVRDGGGHVGFYAGEDGEAYHVLGGNQGTW